MKKTKKKKSLGDEPVHIGVSFGMVDGDPKGLLQAELADMKLQKTYAERRIAEIEELLDDMGRKKITMADIEVVWPPSFEFGLGPVVISYGGNMYGHMQLNGNVTPFSAESDPLKVTDLVPEELGLVEGRHGPEPALIYNPEKNPQHNR